MFNLISNKKARDFSLNILVEIKPIEFQIDSGSCVTAFLQQMHSQMHRFRVKSIRKFGMHAMLPWQHNGGIKNLQY